MRSFGFFAEAGFVNNFMIEKPSTQDLEANIYSLSGKIGAGISYNFSYGFTAELSADYTNGFTDTFKDADYSYHILGFELSLLKSL